MGLNYCLRRKAALHSRFGFLMEDGPHVFRRHVIMLGPPISSHTHTHTFPSSTRQLTSNRYLEHDVNPPPL